MPSNPVNSVLAAIAIAISIAAMIYAIYALLRILWTTLRNMLRLENLWLWPLSILNLDHLFRSEAGRVLVRRRSLWTWRALMAVMVATLAVAAWAMATAPHMSWCSDSTEQRPKAGCPNMRPVPKIK